MSRFTHLLTHLSLATAILTASSGSALATTPGMKMLRLANTNRSSYQNLYFGFQNVLTDQHALVGAPSANGKGAVYVFDLSTGNQVRKIATPVGAAGDRFGTALHAAQGMIVIGAPKRGTGAGAIYLADPANGSLTTAMTCPQNDRTDFGTTISGSGRTFLVSSLLSGLSMGPTYRFAFDGTSNSSPGLVMPGGGSSFTPSHAHDGDLAVILQNTDLQLFDVSAGATNRHLFSLPREVFPTHIIRNVALGGGRLLVGSPDEAVPGATQAGAVYLLTPIAQPVDMEEVAVRGAAAPKAPGSHLGSLQQAVIGRDYRASMLSTLTGPASNGGKDVGVWTNLRSSLEKLASRSRDDQGGGVATGTASGLLNNHIDHFVFQSTLIGSGITAQNNRVLVGLDYWANPTTLLRTGSPVSGLGNANALLHRLHQVTQSANVPQVGVAFSLRSSTGGITPGNDSGLVLINNANGSTNNLYHEGGSVSPIPGVKFGQFHPRIGFGHHHIAFTTALDSDSTTNAAVFVKEHTANNYLAIARKGSVAPGAAPAVFAAFHAEATSRSGVTLLRATLQGEGVTAANNEGLWIHGPNLAAHGLGMKVTGINLPHGSATRDASGIGGKGLATLLRRWSNSPTRIVTRLTFDDRTTRLVTVR